MGKVFVYFFHHPLKEICKIILEDVEDKNPKDNSGNTPLHEAAKNGHDDIFQLLLDHSPLRLILIKFQTPSTKPS